MRWMIVLIGVIVLLPPVSEAAPTQSYYEGIAGSPGDTGNMAAKAPNRSAETNSEAFPFIRGNVDDPNGRNGAWLNWHTKFKTSEQRLGGSEAWYPALERISTLIKDGPAMATLREYYPWVSYWVDKETVPATSAHISIIYWLPKWVLPAPELPDGFRLKEGAWGYTPTGPDLWINRFPPSAFGASEAFHVRDWYRDAGGEFFRMEPPDRYIEGFPVQGGWLYITAEKKAPLFLPVSQERVLKAFIAHSEQQLALVQELAGESSEVLDSYNSPEMKQLRRQMIDDAAAGEDDPQKAAEKRAKAERDDAEQERQIREIALNPAISSPVYAAAKSARDAWSRKLARMSAVERAAPAYVRNDPEGFLSEDLAASAEPGSVSLVQYNPDFFDETLQPHIPQLIIIPVGSSFDSGRSPEALARMTVTERATIAVAERTRWSELRDIMR